MKASTILEKVKLNRHVEEKEQILRGLSALLLSTPATRKKARLYLIRAIAFIEEK